MFAYQAADLDYFNSALLEAQARFAELPQPLAWIEPSINMPYLQACASYVFGQSYGAILLTGVTLDHSLRLAVVDREAGAPHSMKREIWESLPNTLGGILGEKATVIAGLIPSATDLKWWKEVAKVVRNKTAHLDVPYLIQVLGRDETLVGWYQDDADEQRVFADRTWWGAFFHRTQDLVAIAFLRQAARQIAELAKNSGWGTSQSAFDGQRGLYDEFFAYTWTIEEEVKSLKKIINSTRKATRAQLRKPSRK